MFSKVIRKTLYPVFDYFYDHDAARSVLHLALTGLFLWAIIPLELWRFSLALFVFVFMHWLGLIDGAVDTVKHLRK